MPTTHTTPSLVRVSGEHPAWCDPTSCHTATIGEETMRIHERTLGMVPGLGAVRLGTVDGDPTPEVMCEQVTVIKVPL